MPTGPLRTFFRQDAGFPDDEPDMTDFLLEGMIRRGQSMPAGAGRIPTSTSPARATGAGGYPQMPGPPQRSMPMPRMPQQTFGDLLSQALAGAGDVVSAGGGRQTNYLQGVLGRQQGLRNESYQQALAQRAAMEQAEQLARQYDWQVYGAGVQQRKQDYYEKTKDREADLYEKMLGKEKEKAERFRALLAETLPMELAQAEDVGELKALSAKAMRETQGDPDLMAEVRRAEQLRLQQIIKQMQPGAGEKALKSLSDFFVPMWAEPLQPEQPTLLPFRPKHEPQSRHYSANPWGPYQYQR